MCQRSLEHLLLLDIWEGSFGSHVSLKYNLIYIVKTHGPPASAPPEHYPTKTGNHTQLDVCLFFHSSIHSITTIEHFFIFH